MKMRPPGRTGIQVSPYCLGTMMSANRGGSSRRRIVTAVEQSLRRLRTDHRRGLQRFRTEQPTCSVLDRGIEREILPVCQRYGMGTLVWSPLAMGLLTGRYRKGRETT